MKHEIDIEIVGLCRCEFQDHKGDNGAILVKIGNVEFKMPTSLELAECLTFGKAKLTIEQ